MIVVVEAVRQTIARHSLCRPGERIGAAVSGGADSVALLETLRVLASELNVELRIAHVNYGLRGDDSDQDQAFVERLAADHGLEVRVRRVALNRRGNLEQEARQARYHWFRELIDEGWVDKIATGHHRDDQAETVLFRLLRGAAGPGLAGIRPTIDGVIRPLLDVRRETIRSELRARGLAWREDASNRDLSYSRNRLRHETLPRLAADWNPKLVDALARTADAASTEEDYWAETVEPLFESLWIERNGWLEASVGEVAALHRALRRRVLRRALERVRGDLLGLDAGHMARMEELLERDRGSGAVEAPGATVERSCGRVRILRGRRGEHPPGKEVAMTPPASADAPDRRSRIVLASEAERTETGGYTNRDGFVLDADRVPRSLILREKRSGDRWGGRGRLKELFQRARVPEWERGGWPVLTAQGDPVDEARVVWCRGFGVAPEFQAGPESRRRVKIREVDDAGREIRRIADWAGGVYRS